MDPRVVDAVKFLERLIGECDGGPDTHSWRKCRRCLAEFHVENREPFAMALLRAAIEALRGPGAVGPQATELFDALRELRVNANRLCDRQLGGTYEEDCRRSIARVNEALRANATPSPEPREAGQVLKATHKVEQWASENPMTARDIGVAALLAALRAQCEGGR